VMKLINYRSLLVVAAVLVIAGCSRTAVQFPQQASLPVPDATATQIASLTNPERISNQSIQIADFVSPAAFSKMNAADKVEASSAQFFSLQFGRPGAPRSWKSSTGVRGSITVGPFVRVNSLNCREFTNTITIDDIDSVKSGTSCREADGRWFVENAS